MSKNIEDTANELCYIEEQKGNATTTKCDFDSFINFFANFELDAEGWYKPPQREDILKGWNESRQRELDIYFEKSVRNVETIEGVLELLELVRNRIVIIQRVPNDIATKGEHLQLCRDLIAQLETRKEILLRKEQDTAQAPQGRAKQAPTLKSLLLRGSDEEKAQIIENIRKVIESKQLAPKDIAKMLQALANENYINTGNLSELAKSWVAEFEPSRMPKSLSNCFYSCSLGSDKYRRKYEQDIRNYQELIFE